MDDSGLLGIVAAIVGVVVAGVVGTGVYLYATDYALKADVRSTDCVPVVNVVTVETRLFGIDHDVEGVPDRECTLLQPGDYVEYRIRSKQTTLYRDGDCLYDSTTGVGCGQGLRL